jgi:hypothetical protein
MPARVTQRRRVGEEALRSVKPCQRGRTGQIRKGLAVTVPSEEAPANSVPAAAVIRGEQALSGITGRKGRVGGQSSQM